MHWYEHLAENSVFKWISDINIQILVSVFSLLFQWWERRVGHQTPCRDLPDPAKSGLGPPLRSHFAPCLQPHYLLSGSQTQLFSRPLCWWGSEKPSLSIYLKAQLPHCSLSILRFVSCIAHITIGIHVFVSYLPLFIRRLALEESPCLSIFNGVSKGLAHSRF